MISALIPAAGLGTRLKHHSAKELILTPRNGQLEPVICASLRQAAVAGCEYITVVVSSRKPGLISALPILVERYCPGSLLKLAFQENPTGLAAAVSRGLSCIDPEYQILLLLPDTLVEPDMAGLRCAEALSLKDLAILWFY